MLSQYANEYGFENCEYFVDDGYSGTNFNHPDFQRMIRLHTLIDRIVIHEKEMDGDEIIMRVDVYYRFIGYVGDKNGADMRAPQIRRNRWGKKVELVREAPEAGESDEIPGK